MIKQAWIAECDMCKKVETAKAVCGRHNETEYTLPDGWSWRTARNKEFILCPECQLKDEDTMLIANAPVMYELLREVADEIEINEDLSQGVITSGIDKAVRKINSLMLGMNVERHNPPVSSGS